MSEALQGGLLDITGRLRGRGANGEAGAPRVHQRMCACPQSLSHPGTRKSEQRQRQCRMATQGHTPRAHQRASQGAPVRWVPPPALGVGIRKVAPPLSAVPHSESAAVTSSRNGASTTGRKGKTGSSKNPASPGMGMQYSGANASVLASADSPESAAISHAGQGPVRPRVVHQVPVQGDDSSLADLLLLLRSISNSTGLSRSASAPDEAQINAVLRSLPGTGADSVPEGGVPRVPEAEAEAAQYRVEAEEQDVPLAPISSLPRLLRMRASELSPESLEVLAGPSGEGGVPQAVLDAEWPLEVVQLPLLARMAWDEKALDAQEGALGGAPEEGALGESEGYASEEEGEGGVGGSRSSWMELLLAGAKDGAGVTLGCAPATAEEMEWVLETTGCSVIICLQDEDSMGLLGSSFQAVGRKAAERHVGLFHIPMREHDEESQASALPEAVRVLASLLSTGHRVHITCIRGVTCSPLVVLGYLTFFKGEEFSKAVAWLKGCCPGASPSCAAWEQAKERLAASLCLQKMADKAFDELRTRSYNGAKGSTVGDWMAAQRKLLAEAMQQRVADDVAMTQLLAEAKVLQVEESAAAGTEAEQATKERVRQLASEVDRLERRQVEAAGEAARAARRMEAFRQKLVKLQESEAGAKEEAAAAERRVAELRRQLEEVEERERRIVLARDETTSIGSSSALSAAEAAYHRELEEGLEMELQGLREENRALAHAVDAARVELQGAEKRAQDLRERLNKVQKLGVASIAASASAASSAASGVPGVAETSGITGAATEVGTSSAVDRPDPAALEDASTVASAPLDVLSEPFPGSLLEVLRERERERAEGGREGGEGEGTWEGGAGGDGEGLFAGDEEVAEVIERLTRIVHNEMEVHSVAQYTVKKLAAAAQQLEELQRREEELVHVWQDTQERVQQLTQQLSSAEATAQRHMEELSNVAHHSHTTQDEDSHAPAPQGIDRALFQQYQPHRGEDSSLGTAQWKQPQQQQQQLKKGHGQGPNGQGWQPAMSEVEQALGQRIGAAAAVALERTRQFVLLMQAVALKVLAVVLALGSEERYARVVANWGRLREAVSSAVQRPLPAPLVKALGVLATLAQASWKIAHPLLSALALGVRFLWLLLLSLIASRSPGAGPASS